MFHGQSPIREELPGAELKIRKLLFMADMAITAGVVLLVLLYLRDAEAKDGDG